MAGLSKQGVHDISISDTGRSLVVRSWRVPCSHIVGVRVRRAPRAGCPWVTVHGAAAEWRTMTFAGNASTVKEKLDLQRPPVPRLPAERLCVRHALAVAADGWKSSRAWPVVERARSHVVASPCKVGFFHDGRRWKQGCGRGRPRVLDENVARSLLRFIAPIPPAITHRSVHGHDHADQTGLALRCLTEPAQSSSRGPATLESSIPRYRRTSCSWTPGRAGET